MKVSNIVCPSCGSLEVSREELEGQEQLTLGPQFQFKAVNFKCGSCGEEGDFTSETDKNFVAAQKSALASFVRSTVEELGSKSVSMAYFERVFELPVRTATRWKTGDFSSSAVALLRIVKTYPWITEVAENKFDFNFSQTILVREAANSLEKVSSRIPGASFRVELKSNASSVSGAAIFTITAPKLKVTAESALSASGG